MNTCIRTKNCSPEPEVTPEGNTRTYAHTSLCRDGVWVCGVCGEPEPS